MAQRESGRRNANSGAERRSGPSSAGQRMVIGVHPVRELLRAGHPIFRLMLADTRADTEAVEELVALAQQQQVVIQRTARAALDHEAPDLVHQGVVAWTRQLEPVDPAAMVAAALASGEIPLLVAVDGVTDPHNLGSIARSAEAAGAHGLIVPGRRTSSITPTVEKAAAGALAHLAVATVTNLVRTLAELSKAGVWSIGLDGDADVELSDHPLVGEPCVLVVGAEGSGLSRLTRERCDAVVRLPMRGRVGSLNASVAAGIALYTIAAAHRDA